MMQVGIAGAGLAGRLMAWQLLRAGHAVTLFDQDNREAERSAAKVAAAMIAPFSEVVHCEREIFDWGLTSLDLWPGLLCELEQDSGVAVYFQHRGSIVVAHRQDQAYLDHFNQMLRSRVPEFKQDYEFLAGDALKQLEPSLGDRFTAGTYLHREGCLDNWALLDVLAKAIDQLGGRWFENTSILAITPGGVQTQQQTHNFDLVIDTRGFGARKDLSQLRGVRGEVLWVRAPEVSLSRPVRLMHPRYQLYIAPKPGDMYVIGATEIESESLKPITVRSSLELQSALYSVSSRFAEANIIKAYANCRPTYPDNLPRIDHQPGLMRINGLYRHGYLLSPFVIRAALNTLNGQPDTSIVNTMPMPQINTGA